MTDLFVDHLTHDLILEDNTVKLISRKKDLVRQKLDVTLKAFQGEWFLDIFFGVPYLETATSQGILDKANLTFADFEIQQAIRGVEGVVNIETYSSNYSAIERTLSVNFSVLSEVGEIITTSVEIGG